MPVTDASHSYFHILRPWQPFIRQTDNSSVTFSPPHTADCLPLLSCFRGDVDVSAVCQYQIGDVKKVFEGSYKEYREASQRWGRYTGATPSPRPGSVRNPTQESRDISGSREKNSVRGRRVGTREVMREAAGRKRNG